MMGFSVLFIFALLQICTLCDGGNSEDLSNIKSTDSSNHHPHHLHPRDLFRHAKAEKEEEPLDLKTNLEFVASNDPPKDAVLVSDDSHNEYYILGSKKCNKMKLDIIRSSEISSKGAKALREFLVNKDNFEILEWKRWEEIESGQIPFHPVIVCEKFYIVENNKGISSVTKSYFNKINMQTFTLVLSLNNDIKEQHLEIDDYVFNKEEKKEREEVLKLFTAHNMNCKPAKHVVKLDHGSDRSRAFLKGRTHTVGGAIEASVSGDILKIVKVGGKISTKYDYSRLNSETTSKLNKALHSASVELEVPPNQSCVIEIKSRARFARVPYSGRLTRLYNNGEERTTSIEGIYDHQETDLESFVYPCTPVTNATQCP